MRIKGKKFQPREEVVVLPRGDDNIVFKAQAVLDYSDFDALCPQPKPPTKMLKGGETHTNPEDPGYQEKLNEWGVKRTHWMVLKSLSATEGLEWETVKMDDPTTWENYEKELSEVLSPVELSAVIGCVTDACGLNQQKIDEATKRFLAGQAQA